MSRSYFSGWDILCAMLFLGIMILGFDILIALIATLNRIFW